jgi:hypothetical protein
MIHVKPENKTLLGRFGDRAVSREAMLSALPLCLSLVLPPAAPVGGRVAARASVRMAGDGVKFGDLDGSEARIGIIRVRLHPGAGLDAAQSACAPLCCDANQPCI